MRRGRNNYSKRRRGAAAGKTGSSARVLNSVRPGGKQPVTKSVLYSVERTAVSQLDSDFLDNKNKPKPADRVKEVVNRSKDIYSSITEERRNVKKRRSALTVKRKVSRINNDSGEVTRVDSPEKRGLTGKSAGWFYAGLTAAILAVVGFAAAAMLGVFSPDTSTVMINDSGRIMYAGTTKETVGELLDTNGIVLGDSDILEIPLSSPIEDDMEIIIRRAATVNIDDNGTATQVKMLAGTVGEALDRAGVVLGTLDQVYPSKDKNITAGMTITILRVQLEYTTEDEILTYKEITKESSKYSKGKKVLAQAGEEGLQTHKIEITYINGEEYSRETVETVVVKEPVDEITYVGTYVAPKKTVNTGANNKKDSDGKLTQAPTIEQLHSGTWAEHRKVAAPADSIIAKTVVAHNVTAYTHTGNKTATGTWPRIGTIAANPKQVPYGTKIYVPGYGYGRVEDTGANRHDLSQYFFDVFFETKGECRQWGRKTSLKVYILK